MKIRSNYTLISIVLMSLGLMVLVPGALRFISTWRELYLDVGDHQESNLLMPLGLFSLGFQIIGLIVLWTGYKKNERWAWFVMLIIILFFVAPPSVLTLLITKMQTQSFRWSDWFVGIREGYWPSIWMAVGVLNFLAMFVALLLPIKAFFWRPTKSKAVDEYHGEEKSPSTGSK